MLPARHSQRLARSTGRTPAHHDAAGTSRCAPPARAALRSLRNVAQGRVDRMPVPTRNPSVAQAFRISRLGLSRHTSVPVTSHVRGDRQPTARPTSSRRGMPLGGTARCALCGVNKCPGPAVVSRQAAKPERCAAPAAAATLPRVRTRGPGPREHPCAKLLHPCVQSVSIRAPSFLFITYPALMHTRPDNAQPPANTAAT